MMKTTVARVNCTANYSLAGTSSSLFFGSIRPSEKYTHNSANTGTPSLRTNGRSELK